MRDADAILFMMRSSAIRTAILAVAVAASACALGDADSTDEPVVNEHITSLGAPPIFDLNGTWFDGSTTPVMREAIDQILIDWPASVHRKQATGDVRDPLTIRVNFPDDATFSGTLQLPNLIHWSNGTNWKQVFAGTLAVNLNGRFTDGRLVYSVSNHQGVIAMTARGRDPAHGFAWSAAQIEINFPDGGTFLGTLLGPDRILWSNGTLWQASL